MKKNASRIMSVILCIALLLSVTVQGMVIASADSEIEVNLVENGDFENAEKFNPEGYDGLWHQFREAAQSSEDHQSGTHCAKLTGAASNDSSIEQDISGLVVGNVYTITVWAKLASDTANKPHLGVKQHNGSTNQDEFIEITSTDWQQYTLDFTYSSSTYNARVYVWTGSMEGSVYVDDYKVTTKTGLRHARIENGQIDVDLISNSTPQLSDFSATYTTNLNTTAQELELSQKASSEGSISLGFTEFPKVNSAQTVTVTLTYSGQQATQAIELDFTVEADPDAPVIEGELESLTAQNGTLTAVLTENPTVPPTAEDFEFTIKVDDGDARLLTVRDFAYSILTKTVTAAFDPITGGDEADKQVTVTATYNETTVSYTYTVPVITATIYYVSADGNDSNIGTSIDAPFRTIDKINQITLQPGDRVLFRRGDIFSGVLKPIGSGSAQYPIKISSYGDENLDRPKIQEDDSKKWMMTLYSADNNTGNTYVNGAVYLYNVEYYEISDLELYSTSYDNYQSQSNLDRIPTYSSGVRIVNLNSGTLSHFYFNDLIIHGFRGPTTNIGKTSGGINMNVLKTNSSSDVQSTFADIRIENCEIYKCGRSGVNFLNPWGYRDTSDPLWVSDDYGSPSYPRVPVYGFLMSGCSIHDIDGDGLIVDNVNDALVEHNLVYKTSQRTGAYFPASVGLFNWNSNDTVFQYNEVYNVGVGAIDYNGNNVSPPDAQGIEIDAHNLNTWVQYNYMHDNAGGDALWCSHSANNASYNGYYRFNVFENNFNARTDCVLITFGSYAYDSEFTNNVVYYSGTNCLNTSGEINITGSQTSSFVADYKFYNNIFVYEGEEKAISNFVDNGIDWQSNIFCGISNLPVNDDPAHPNIKADPLFAAPNSAENGTFAGTMPDLSGYTVGEGSPALNAGVYLESMDDEWFNGDFFGNNPDEFTADIGICIDEVEIPPIDPDNPDEHIFKLGNVDHSIEADGTDTINATDATLVLQYFAKIITDESDAAFDKELADVNGDNDINATDATLILQYFAKIITSFPAENAQA